MHNSITKCLTAATALLGFSSMISAAPGLIGALEATDKGKWPINCAGAGMCSGTRGLVDSAIAALNTVEKNTLYLPQSEIWCKMNPLGFDTYCVFLQGMDKSYNVYYSPSTNISSVGIDSTTVIELLNALKDHQCSGCGSVLVSKAANMSSAVGYLTLNYVHPMGGCGHGLCPGSLAPTNPLNPLNQTDAVMTTLSTDKAITKQFFPVNGGHAELPVFFANSSMVAEKQQPVKVVSPTMAATS